MTRRVPSSFTDFAVIITNALGQVLANTVLASDNATIAVPASGIVFVAVDGAAVSKVLVK